jgi:hypothetical protein
LPHLPHCNSSTGIERRQFSSSASLCVSGFGSQEDSRMANVQDYLKLASEAEDLAAWMPDPELATSYHRLADSYQRLARFNNQLSTLLINCGDGRDH